MEYKVIQAFICKNVRTLYIEGSLYFCDDENRANELANKGYIDKPKKRQVKKKVVDE